jgi:hypothetical protein
VWDQTIAAVDGSAAPGLARNAAVLNAQPDKPAPQQGAEFALMGPVINQNARPHIAPNGIKPVSLIPINAVFLGRLNLGVQYVWVTVKRPSRQPVTPQN